jgi:hypothetical protein
MPPSAIPSGHFTNGEPESDVSIVDVGLAKSADAFPTALCAGPSLYRYPRVSCFMVLAGSELSYRVRRSRESDWHLEVDRDRKGGCLEIVQ